MSLTDLLNRPVTLISRSAEGDIDEFGNEIPGEALTETVGELQQRTRDEPAMEGEVTQTEWLLVLPAGTTVRTGDVVEIDNGRYEVTGAPWHARNPRTMLESHVEATLRQTAGTDDVTGS